MEFLKDSLVFIFLLLIIVSFLLLKKTGNTNKSIKELNFFKNKKGSSNLAISKFTIDITKMVEDNKIDPVIGRDEEIKRVIQILSRRKKNNAILLGRAGVGKTAIVEGLASAIIEGRVPSTLLNKRVLKIDMSSILAGTKYRGEFENRFKSLIDNIIAMDKQNIVFIDEIHTIVQAGGAEGAIDADDIIKPPLARGELQMIGTTTTTEYKQYIMPDTSLTRRFEPLKIKEPNKLETLKILKGIKKSYEEYHNITIDDALLKKIIEFSAKIKARVFPDKAIDILDEVCAKVRLDNIKNNKTIKITEKDIKDISKYFKKQEI